MSVSSGTHGFSARRLTLTFLTLALALPGCWTTTPTQCSALAPGLAASIDSLFAGFASEESPGCAVTVLQGDEVVYRQGYGMADLEHGIPITRGSVFRTGSVSKQFTAAVIVLLAEQGALSLDDPVRKFLPEIPDFGYEITLRHLLHHTSGIRDYLDLMALAGRGSDDFYRKEQALDLLARQEGLNFPPGDRFLYSNSGYFLLSQVVERATGRSLRLEAQDRIFGPLGMDHTHFHDDRDEIVVGRANGYGPKEGGGFELAMTRLDLVGDGGVFTTIEDLGLWLASLETLSLDGGSFLPTLLTRGALNDGSTLDYAMGIGHGIHRGLAYVGHGGSFVGFRAATLRFPGEHLSVGLLCNRADVNPMGMALGVAEQVLAEKMAPSAPTPDRGPSQDSGARGEEPAASPPSEDILGSYFSPELDATYEVRLEEGSPVVEMDGIRVLPMVFQRSGVYQALFITLRFRREDGRVVGLEATLPRASAIQFQKR